MTEGRQVQRLFRVTAPLGTRGPALERYLAYAFRPLGPSAESYYPATALASGRRVGHSSWLNLNALDENRDRAL